MEYRKVVAGRPLCPCGAQLVDDGAALLTLPAARIDAMPPGVAWEVLLPDRTLVPVARCKRCHRRTAISTFVRVTKMIPNPHDCPCGCGYTVYAMREVAVSNYYPRVLSAEG